MGAVVGKTQGHACDGHPGREGTAMRTMCFSKFGCIPAKHLPINLRIVRAVVHL